MRDRFGLKSLEFLSDLAATSDPSPLPQAASRPPPAAPALAPLLELPLSALGLLRIRRWERGEGAESVPSSTCGTLCVHEPKPLVQYHTIIRLNKADLSCFHNTAGFKSKIRKTHERNVLTPELPLICILFTQSCRSFCVSPTGCDHCARIRTVLSWGSLSFHLYHRDPDQVLI